MVGVDCNFLSLMLHPTAQAPDNPATGKPIERLRERIEFLIDQLDEDEERIIIPTPVLAEFLILAKNDGPDYLRTISQSNTMLLKPFDERAAIELAAMELADRAGGDKRGGASTPWQKLKIDRQVVAIAKVNNVHTIYVDDIQAKNLAKRMGLKTVSSWELHLPPSDAPLFDNLPEVEEAADLTERRPPLMLMPPSSDAQG